MVAFDNDQVVGKSWRVSTDNKVKSSCYTGFVRKLDNIRNQDGNYFDEVYDTHYQMLCHNFDKYTMHNKFSNCLSWVSPSTSDLKIHLMT